MGFYHFWEAVTRRCSVKKVFLEISQNSEENTSVRASFLIKLLAEACNFIKKETVARVFSCEFCEIPKNTFLQNSSGRLRLDVVAEKMVFCHFCLSFVSVVVAVLLPIY